MSVLMNALRFFLLVPLPYKRSFKNGNFFIGVLSAVRQIGGAHYCSREAEKAFHFRISKVRFFEALKVN